MRQQKDQTNTELPLPLEQRIVLQIVVALSFGTLFNALFATSEELGWHAF
ncbi:MAG: hypothetical protein QGM50_00845 [Anaerolineae bacterium]|nr:hypothetical protein [Anaerolineae bacterium]MDK1080220.1 hypothetical protein [Anaerolineae bacterium]MDK1117313.1 hypothetical protein [Anaerolineae bacterium]